MTVDIRKSFTKDSRQLPKAVRSRVFKLIVDLEFAPNLTTLTGWKKLHGYTNAYRIRVGAHRIGFFLTSRGIDLLPVLSRKEIYRYFP